MRPRASASLATRLDCRMAAPVTVACPAGFHRYVSERAGFLGRERPTLKHHREIAILGAKRTPIGSFNGTLGSLTAPQLGGFAIREAIANSGLPQAGIDQTYMGVVLSAGLGQAPARQAAFNGGVGKSTPATTVNKMCGSGMSAVTLGCNAIALGQAKTVVAGGMESMTNAPHLLPHGRWGKRLGESVLLDHLMLDGLEDAYDKGVLMGLMADRCAERYQISRKEQDSYAAESYRRAITAGCSDAFRDELVPVETTNKRRSRTVTVDEEPERSVARNMAALRPAFRKNGTVTAASSSKISDGAAALLLADWDTVQHSACKPIGRIVSHSSIAMEPESFPVAPVNAVSELLSNAGWKLEDVELWEVNEAFAVVPLIFMRETGVPHEQLNVHGGACALGHPIGASGARIIVTLIHAMRSRGARRGIAAICIGGGEATALAVELV